MTKRPQVVPEPAGSASAGSGYRVPRSEALFARAQLSIPGGVNSPVRSFGAVGGTPRFIASGSGPYIVDADGRRYVDFVCSWGPMILGHGHPAVRAAVHAAVERGTSFGAPTEAETALAETLVSRVGPVERVRLTCSGTEATMTAVRLARAVTGRRLVVKFVGCYHGHVDGLLPASGSGLATLGLTDHSGGSDAAAGDTVVVPYNDADALTATFEMYGSGIACVIAEAAPANMGVVPPQPGFTSLIARLCRQHGALFISDEVLTGFRVGPAGWYGIERVAPDLLTFGKVIGGGFPVGALGGRADLMEYLAPTGPVYQAGTLSGNPVACAAGLVTLQHCTSQTYERMGTTAHAVGATVSDHLAAAGVPHRVQYAGTLLSVFFADGEVTDYDGARRQDLAAHRAFFHAMLAQGVYLPPSAFEAWFVSAAHDDAALSAFTSALPSAARAAATASQRSAHDDGGHHGD